LITHRDITQLRLQRSASPQPPFWQAVTIAPYGLGRGLPVQINYLTLTADAKSRVEVSVTRSVRDQLERERFVESPALIDASEVSELVYRRGEETLEILAGLATDAICLVSSNGAVPALEPTSRSMIAVSCWPLRFGDIERLFARCGGRGGKWGALLPLLHPITTGHETIERLAGLAAKHRALFFAAVPIETEPPARQALARMEGSDDDSVTELFDADLEAIVVAAERFAARAAAERGLLDHVPALAPLTSNWTAAMKLSLAGTRLIRMGASAETGWTLHQSSKLVARLTKPLERIASAASLSIIDALDPVSVSALEQWLHEGRSEFFEEVDGKWRGQSGPSESGQSGPSESGQGGPSESGQSGPSAERA
jgi:hypothetical protein